MQVPSARGSVVGLCANGSYRLAGVVKSFYPTTLKSHRITAVVFFMLQRILLAYINAHAVAGLCLFLAGLVEGR